MALYHFLPMLGSLCLCRAYVSQGYCPSLLLLDPVANYQHLLSNNSYYPIASEAYGPISHNYGYRYLDKRGPMNTLKTYIYTKDHADHCLLISSGALNDSKGHIIEINALLPTETAYHFEMILSFSECNRSVMNKTVLWHDSDLLFFWMCFDIEDHRNIQFLLVFMPTILKKEISLKAEKIGYNATVKSYTKTIENLVIKYMDVKILERIKFHWKDIITRSLSEPPTMGTTKLVLIIIFLALFGIGFCVTISKLK